VLNFTSDLKEAIAIPPKRNLNAAAPCIFALRIGAAVGGNEERGQEVKASEQLGETCWWQ
jgi:hypothetical protein